MGFLPLRSRNLAHHRRCGAPTPPLSPCCVAHAAVHRAAAESRGTTLTVVPKGGREQPTPHREKREGATSAAVRCRSRRCATTEPPPPPRADFCRLPFCSLLARRPKGLCRCVWGMGCAVRLAGRTAGVVRWYFHVISMKGMVNAVIISRVELWSPVFAAPPRQYNFL